jgi:hypothetical protein
MVDIQLVFDGITLAASIVVVIGAIVAVYVAWSWTRFARGEWTIRKISFFPPQAVERIFNVEMSLWQKAALGETLPQETLSIRVSKDEQWTPVKGLTGVTLRRRVLPPAVLVNFVVVNPSIIPAAITEVTLMIRYLVDESTYKFAPTHYGKKEGVDKPGAPARVQFEDFWRPILIKPATCSTHRLVFAPAELMSSITAGENDKIFTDLVVGKYECSLELKFERLCRLMKKRGKSRRIVRVVDIGELSVEEWKHDKEVVV